MNVIKKDFYLRNTLIVAKDLLGCVITRNINGKIKQGIIVETEAYTQEDPSCHAYSGITKRSKTMFEEGGISYVYFTYGMYHCMNIVTEENGRGCAVLIRAVEPLYKTEDNTRGPARFCRAFEITKEENGIDLTKENSPIFIEEGEKIPKENIVQTTRIGISKGIELPWRFYIKNNKWISKP